MRTVRKSGNDTRRVLSAMITDATVCSRIAGQWKPPGLFGFPPANLIGSWCIKHIREYGRPLGREVETVYHDWVAGRNGEDTSTVSYVEKFLDKMSQEYERSDEKGHAPDYVLDLAGRLFNGVRLRAFADGVESDLDANEVEAAQSRVSEHNRVELGVDEIVRVGDDWDPWRDAFDDEQAKPLVTWPGTLGKFLGREFARDSFVAFMASSKRGKSFWLADLDYRAVRQGNRVVHFEAGDLSQRQVIRRLGMRALRRPRRDDKVRVPVEWEENDKELRYENRNLDGVAPQEAFKAWKKIQRGKDRFRLSCHPNSSLSLETVHGLLIDWGREDWVPDVVTIDYADILASPHKSLDKRDQINENWKFMRRLSQEFHCLVVTATQADANSYTRGLLGRQNFSDDRRKHDHVTAMLGLNVTDEDKARGVTRLNWLDRRDDEFLESRQVYVAGCLAVGCPAIVSCY